MKRIFIFLFALVLALGLCLVMLTPVAADPGTTYYVSTTGSDVTGDGSWFYPWQTIQYAVSQVASGDTIEVAPGTYVEDPETVIDKNLSIHGAGSTQTTIKPSADTASNGQMVLVNPDVTMHISDVTFDGTGKKVWYALKYKGGGSVIDCDFTNIQYNPSGPNYQGIAICAYGEAYDDTIDFDDNVDITGCTFTGIGRVGVLYFGPGITDSTYSGNTYVGKGDGDWLDYALDVGSGPNVAVTGSTISDCTGVASSDGSTSAGVMVTDLYKDYCPAYSGTEAAITGNDISGCTAGIAVGYDETDLSIATVSGNTFEDNKYQVDCMPDVDVDLEATLAGNTFDRAVVVRGSGIKVPTIFSNIQDAIDAADSGDTVNVMAGTYDEQVLINKDLTLQGTGNPVIKAPSSPGAFTFPESGASWEPVVFAFGGTNTAGSISGTETVSVNISDFTIHGNDRVPTDRSAGILLRNAGGTVSDNTIQNMYVDGKQTFGIMVYGDSNVAITGNDVSGYARGGIGANGDSTTSSPSYPTPDVLIDGNTVTGPGMEVPVTWAPNGIQIGWGATGEIAGNNVTGNGWPGTDWSGSGIIVAGADGVEIDGNTVEDNETGIAVCGWMWNPAGVTADDTWIHDNTVDGNTYGISLQDKTLDTTIEYNTVTGSSYDGIDICNFYGYAPTGTVIQFNSIVDNNVEEDATSGGVWIMTGVDGNEVTVNFNSIAGNGYGILNTSTTNVVDATANWWGDASGPYNATTNPSGTGNSVSDNVDYSPWWGANYIGVAHPWEWYTNDSIQEAIDAASAGDTVNVMAGTYVEDLVISAGKDGLELKGNGCNVTTIKGVATAEVTPVYNIRFDEFDGVSGVKIHGFTIESPDVPTNHFASGMVLNGQDIEIYDNCFVSKGAEGAEDNYCVAIQTWRWSAAPDSDLSGLKIYDNSFSSEGDLWVYQGVFVNRDGEDFGDIAVSGNDFTGNIHMGIAYEGNNAVISDNTMTSTYEGVGIAVMDWAELGQDDVDVDGNELQGFDYGVLVGRGAQVMTNITVANNVFSNNNYQVRDRVDTLNMEDVLAGNTFDRAVVVRGSGIKVPIIFSSIQDAIDVAVAGDTVEVMVATYDESVTIDKNNLTLTGEVSSKPAITGGLKLDDVSGFTLQNFEVTGTEDPTKNSLVRMYGVITDLTVDSCVFDGENTADRNGFSGGQIEGDLTITNSEFKDIASWAVLDTRSGSGGDGSAMETVTFADNNVHDCDGSIVFRGLSTNWTDNVYIYSNAFQDIGEEAVSDHWAAFEVNRATNVEIYDNEIRNVVECSWGEGQAMQLWQVGTVSIHDNTIENNYMGIAFLKWPVDETYDVSNISIHYNKFSGNDQYALSVEDGLTGGLVDATANWWGAASGPYNDPRNLGGEGDTVSDNVLFEPWYGDEGMTMLVGYSTYEFVYDVPDVIVACEDTEIPVTFQTDELGAVGYYGVRFKFDATGPGDVIFKATDSEEEHTFVNSGFWGPSAGFNLTADYSDTTDWSMNFSEPGEYNITFSLIEAPGGDVVAGIEGSEDIMVRAVDILDHYHHLHEPFDEVTTLDLLAAADDWIANEVPPGFDEPITTMQLLALADEWFSS